jgi:hypothetical protein
MRLVTNSLFMLLSFIYCQSIQAESRYAFPLLGLYVQQEPNHTQYTGMYTEDAGLHWLPADTLPLPPKNNMWSWIFDIKCNSTGKQCLGMGAYQKSRVKTLYPYSFYSDDGGKNWTITKISTPGRQIINALSCDKERIHCAAVGNELDKPYAPIAYTTHDSGKHWIPSANSPPIPSDDEVSLNHIGCSLDGLTCMAFGIKHTENASERPWIVYQSNDGGNHWKISDPDIPNPSFEPRSLFCAEYCIILGKVIESDGKSKPYIAMSNVEGTKWQTIETQPHLQHIDNYGLVSITCSSDNKQCISLGYYQDTLDSSRQLLAFYSDDGGRNWYRGDVPLTKGNASAYKAVCDDAKLCIATVQIKRANDTVYNLILNTSDGGVTWSASEIFPPKDTLISHLMIG